MISLGESLAVLGAILIVTIISYAAFMYIRRYGSGGRLRSDRCRDVLEQWADSRGIRFDHDLLRIAGAINGIDILVSATYDQIEWSLPPALTMSSIAAMPQQVVLQVGQSWFALEEKIARHRTTVDDGAFESTFKTWSDPPSGAASLLTPALRKHLIELHPDELMYDRGVIEVRWEDDFREPIEGSYERLDHAFAVVNSLCVGTAHEHA